MNSQTYWTTLIYTYILPLSPTVTAIFGWWFIALREENKRCMERKDKRIDIVMTLLDEIEKDAYHYYYKTYGYKGEVCILASQLEFKIDRLVKLCSLINSKSLNELVNKVKAEICGEGFRSTQRATVWEGDPRKYNKVQVVILSLRSQLETYYDDEVYSPKGFFLFRCFRKNVSDSKTE